METDQETYRGVKVGDRIELISMSDDPDPIPYGTKGTVDWINASSTYTGGQIGVDWDNGRTLMLVDQDRFRKIINE